MIDKPKVLFLVQLPPPVHGSSGISNQIVKSLHIRSSFQTKVLALHFAKNMDDLGAFSLRKLAKAIRYAIRLARMIVSFKPDLVYFTFSPKGFSFYRDLAYVVIMRLLKTKFVLHLHVTGIAKNSRGLIKQKLMRYVFHGTPTIILSKLLKGDILEVGNPKLFFIGNGIIQTTKSQRDEQPVNSNRKKRILFLSNLLRAKGIFVLLEAITLIPRELKNNLIVDIVGNEGDVTLDEIKRYLSEHNLTHEVQLHGGKYGEQKFAYYQSADIFVHPTLNDAFPLVILEAMEYGLPVISTFEGAVPEIIDDGTTGFIVPKNNASQLADKLITLLSDSGLCRKFGMHGRLKFLNQYTADRMEKKVAQTLQSIISGSAE